MRQLVAWEKIKQRLSEVDCQVIAASSDTQEEVGRVATLHNITFALAHGITKNHADVLGAGWSDDSTGTRISGGHIEPTEFILTSYGIVLGSMYAAGAVGRMDPEEAIQLIKSRETRRPRH